VVNQQQPTISHPPSTHPDPKINTPLTKIGTWCSRTAELLYVVILKTESFHKRVMMRRSSREKRTKTEEKEEDLGGSRTKRLEPRVQEQELLIIDW